jgi:hypothetical protein
VGLKQKMLAPQDSLNPHAVIIESATWDNFLKDGGHFIFNPTLKKRSTLFFDPQLQSGSDGFQRDLFVTSSIVISLKNIKDFVDYQIEGVFG